MKKFSIITFILLLGLNLGFSVEPFYKNKEGIAINGYDTVAYFTESKAVEGNSKFKTTWKNATWHFASKKNLEAFKKSPEKYAPQFGGYCAWAVGHNYTAKTSPDAWYIENNKLYLNYHKGVQKKWMKDYAKYISQGEKNWPALLAK